MPFTYILNATGVVISTVLNVVGVLVGFLVHIVTIIADTLWAVVGRVAEVEVTFGELEGLVEVSSRQVGNCVVGDELEGLWSVDAFSGGGDAWEGFQARMIVPFRPGLGRPWRERR